MRIAFTNKNIELMKKLDSEELYYVFNSNDTLEELLELSKYCNIIESNQTIYDVVISQDKIVKGLKYIVDEETPIKEILSKPKLKEHKISVIIPNYNYAEWLDKSLGSVLNQTYKNYEVIFVDDVSTDNSRDIATVKSMSFITKGISFEMVALKQKRLNGGSRNEAYLHLSEDSDYVMFLDSDDWLTDEFVLEDINKGLIAEPDVLFVGIQKGEDKRGSFMPDYKTKYDCIIESAWKGSCTKVIKTSLATRQECLFNEGTLFEDKNHHFKICFYMNTFENLKRVTYYWNRKNTKSVSTTRDKTTWGTAPYRNLADALQFSLSIKGKDKLFDEILEKRIELIRLDITRGKDNQN